MLTEQEIREFREVKLMDNEKFIKYLEEKIEYAEAKNRQYEEQNMIRQAEWYDGYEQAFLEVMNFLKKSNS